MIKRVAVVAFVLTLILHLYWLAQAANTQGGDFDVFYYASSIINDPEVPDTAVYDKQIKTTLYPRYNLAPGNDFIYSMVIAYLLAPLSWLPYPVAKFVFGLTSLLAYIAGGLLLARYYRASPPAAISFLTLALLFGPFITNQSASQTNSILFALIAAAIVVADKRPSRAGALIGLAALFKIYPLGLAFLLGIKNLRIAAGALIVFAASFLVPGAPLWLKMVSASFNHHYTWQYLNFGGIGFAVYVWIMLGISYIIIRRSVDNYGTLTAFGLTVLLLVMPQVEWHHLVLLIPTAAFILLSPVPRLYLIAGCAAMFLIGFRPFCPAYLTLTNNEPARTFCLVYFPDFLGIFIFWVIVALLFRYSPQPSDGILNHGRCEFNSLDCAR